MQILLLPSNIKSHFGILLAYSHLNLIHFKGQGQIHGQFNCDSQKWREDSANICIAIKYEGAYGR